MDWLCIYLYVYVLFLCKMVFVFIHHTIHIYIYCIILHFIYHHLSVSPCKKKVDKFIVSSTEASTYYVHPSIGINDNGHNMMISPCKYPELKSKLMSLSYTWIIIMAIMYVYNCIYIIYYIIFIILYYIILYYIMAAVAEEKPCAKLPARFFDGHVVLLSPRGSGDPHLPFERRTRNACGGSGHFEIALCSLGVLELGVTRNPWLSRTETRPSSAHSQLDDGWWCILAAIFPLRVGNLDGWWKIHETLVLMVIIHLCVSENGVYL